MGNGVMGTRVGDGVERQILRGLVGGLLVGDERVVGF